jgi:hypothetical protein
MSKQRIIQPAPETLVHDGRPQFGVFDNPLRNANLMDARYEMIPGVCAPDPIKALRLKKWQFFLIVHPRYTLGMVIIDLGFIASSFLYVFDRETGKLSQHKRMAPSRSVRVADNLWNGRCRFRQKNYSIDIRNQLDKGHHHITLRVGGDAPHVDGEIRLLQNPGGTRPITVCMPVGAERFMYSTKAACTASGTLRIGGEQITFDPTRDTAFMDEHKAFYPHHTYWKWAALAFVGEHGRLVAANMTDNLVKDQESWNENAILTPNATHLLGPVHFNYDPADIMKPWTLHDDDNRVQLTFTPLAVKYDNTNMLVVRTDYRQPMGLFNGALVDGNGNTIQVTDAFGVTEHFDAYY